MRKVPLYDDTGQFVLNSYRVGWCKSRRSPQDVAVGLSRASEWSQREVGGLLISEVT